MDDKKVAELTDQLFKACAGNIAAPGWTTHNVLTAVMDHAQRTEPEGFVMTSMLDWLISRFGKQAVLAEVMDWPGQEIDGPVGHA